MSSYLNTFYYAAKLQSNVFQQQNTLTILIHIFYNKNVFQLRNLKIDINERDYKTNVLETY